MVPTAARRGLALESLIFGAFKNPKQPGTPCPTNPAPGLAQPPDLGCNWGDTALSSQTRWPLPNTGPCRCSPAFPRPVHPVKLFPQPPGQGGIDRWCSAPRGTKPRGGLSPRPPDGDWEMGPTGPFSPLNLQRGLGFLGVCHQPVEARYPQVDVLLAESWRRKRRVVRLGWGRWDSGEGVRA